VVERRSGKNTGGGAPLWKKYRWWSATLEKIQVVERRSGAVRLTMTTVYHTLNMMWLTATVTDVSLVGGDGSPLPGP